MLQKIHLLCFAFLELSWNSDGKNDAIFEPQKSFFGVFNTLLNQWCVKNDKNVFNFAY